MRRFGPYDTERGEGESCGGSLLTAVRSLCDFAGARTFDAQPFLLSASLASLPFVPRASAIPPPYLPRPAVHVAVRSRCKYTRWSPAPSSPLSFESRACVSAVNPLLCCFAVSHIEHRANALRESREFAIPLSRRATCRETSNATGGYLTLNFKVKIRPVDCVLIGETFFFLDLDLLAIR